MRTVGVKELKARLSQYLRAVRAGEALVVTDRGEPVAELRPVRQLRSPADRLEDVLRELAERGEITRAQRARRGWTWRSAGLGLPEGTAERLLEELRGERGDRLTISP